MKESFRKKAALVKGLVFNLAKEDAVPDKDMNEVIWKSIKGEDAVMPAPKRGAFVLLSPKKKDQDDD